jgi:hypothetical protein
MAWTGGALISCPRDYARWVAIVRSLRKLQLTQQARVREYRAMVYRRTRIGQRVDVNQAAGLTANA